jgi:hypothetical protein
MGWKSTIDIKRSEAIQLLISQMIKLEDKSNRELSEMLESYGFGEDSKLPYYGHNFMVEDE